MTSTTESVSATVPPTSTAVSNNDDLMCEEHNTDTSVKPTGNPTRRVSQSTQGVLDALCLLGKSATSIQHHPVIKEDEVASEPIITPHLTASSSSEDDELMPPPPPRSPSTMSAAQDLLAGTNKLSDIPLPSFTFLHDSTRFSNIGNLSSKSVGGGRLRSASNPEGMEKWDLYSRRNDRQHFVLPSSILEEELASTRRILGEVGEIKEEKSKPVAGKTASIGFQQHLSAASGIRRSKRSIIKKFGTSPDSVTDDLEDDEPSIKRKPSKPKKKNTTTKTTATATRKKSTRRSKTPPKLVTTKSPPPEEPEELLRRARSRLLEDLSGGNVKGGVIGTSGSATDENGVMVLPHSLSKYKEVSIYLLAVESHIFQCAAISHASIVLQIHQVYNKNGRIGIYTPAERAAIIQKFTAKRARRVWNKKIRYNCRKNLADRRMRVKGRFVKRSAIEAESNSPTPTEEETVVREGEKAIKEDGGNIKPNKKESSSPPTSGSPLPPVREHREEEEQAMDEDMPDVEDEEAGFEPSEDMPYRRVRRYTIT